MLEYHAYPLDEAGKIISRKDFQAQDDAAALRAAAEICPGGDVEVWCGARVIGKIDRSAGNQSLTGKGGIR